jgi:Flp pilus assembly pilin Flp
MAKRNKPFFPYDVVVTVDAWGCNKKQALEAAFWHLKVHAETCTLTTIKVKRKKAQAMVEYALIVCLLGVALLGVTWATQKAIVTLWGQVAANVSPSLPPSATPTPTVTITPSPSPTCVPGDEGKGQGNCHAPK